MLDNYASIWLIWSGLLIAFWLSVLAALDSREKIKEMIVVSLWTSLFGLTEPFFVPAYWSPPSLFNLAVRTGFDIESLIFAFGIGGIAAVLYEALFKTKHVSVSKREHGLPRHKFHLWAIFSAPVIFILLWLTTNLNPIYSAIIAMFVGGLAVLYCRPDLKVKMFASTAIFLALYFFYFFTLVAAVPGYVERVWNLKAISGILVLGIPIEELLFAFVFGFIWSGVYEHFAWKKIRKNHL